MTESVTRPGIVVSAVDAVAVFTTLTEAPDTATGTWRISTARWEFWAHPDPGSAPERLATIEVAHGTPDPETVTLTRVTLTETAQLQGLTDVAVLNLALSQVGVNIADCRRVRTATPPVFTGRRVTDRSAWTTRALAPELALSLPTQRRSSAPLRLDAVEDRELRRLHFLATFGGLTGGAEQRYEELRGRDRRHTIRPPHEDDLVMAPRRSTGVVKPADLMVDYSDFVVASFSSDGSA